MDVDAQMIVFERRITALEKASGERAPTPPSAVAAPADVEQRLSALAQRLDGFEERMHEFGEKVMEGLDKINASMHAEIEALAARGQQAPPTDAAANQPKDEQPQQGESQSEQQG